MAGLDARPLFIFEMANNHMGSVEHGLAIIRAFDRFPREFPDFRFAFKFQLRHLETFIHPDFQNRFDLKYIKRFSETRLSPEDFRRMRDELRIRGFDGMCTAFDEPSVDLLEELSFEYIKIASCSFNDWPLLERIARGPERPIMASTGGATLEEIDRVVSFFEHRKRSLTLMHCVGEYPTPDENLQINQIGLFQARYPRLRIGYSTHENPDNVDAIKVAIGRGARVFEKHVGLPLPGQPLNSYSASPEQTARWLEAAHRAFRMLGTAGERIISPTEQASLGELRRGVFVRHPMANGSPIKDGDVFFAIPLGKDQLSANEWSKYLECTAIQDIPARAPLIKGQNIRTANNREGVLRALHQVKALLKASNAVIPGQSEIEFSHHYGIERFFEYGSTLITVVNRQYCKKLIIVLAGQTHPEQLHKEKEETFHLLHGDLTLKLNGVVHTMKPGDVVVVERGTRHEFTSQRGAVIEEISSTHLANDSYYTDPAITKNPKRKTALTYWMEDERSL